MKSFSKNLVIMHLAAGAAFGTSIESFQFDNLGMSVPDGDPSGAAITRQVSTSIGAIGSLSVSVDLSAGFAGDVYSILSGPDGRSVVLLNRPGREAGNLFGYFDSGGFLVTFSDGAANDIHTYQSVVKPGSAALTGTWQPDGRRVDPDAVTGDSERTSFLSAFTGTNPNGEWTLKMWDMSSGEKTTLNSWTLMIDAAQSGQPVPDGGHSVAMLLTGVAGIAFLRKRETR